MTQTTHMQNWRPADTLGARLVLVRRELGLSQRAAAEKAGVGFGAWQGMEDGRSPHRMLEVMQKIAVAFGVDREWLLWGGALGGDSDPTEVSTTRRLFSGSAQYAAVA